MGLERSPLSLVRITQELLEWKSNGYRSRKHRDNFTFTWLSPSLAEWPTVTAA
jgi:hypothetical protein